MELKLQLAQWKKREDRTNLYIIVAGSPIQEHGEARLYLSSSDLSDVISYAEAPNLDGALQKLFDEAIESLDEKERTRADFLGWPASFTSFGYVETRGGGFQGYDPFVMYPVPCEALLKFAQLYADRVVEAKKQEKQS